MLLGAWRVSLSVGAAQPPSPPQHPLAEAGDWQTERVELVDGRAYHGLIESEDPTWVYLIEIRRPRAEPMYLVIRPIERSSIASVVRLEPGPRATLQRRIEQFIHRAKIEAGKMDAIRLRMVEDSGVAHHRYQGKWFALDCTADPQTARWLIVRIEQVFTGYRQVLPPRVEPRGPLRLSIFGSLEEYDAYLKPLGLEISNRAAFFQHENLVVAWSELARYAAELADVKARHEELRRELKQLRGELPERLKHLTRQLRRQGTSASEIRRLVSREKRRIQEQIDEKLSDIEGRNRQNDQALDKVTSRMLGRLYHEAFHAYLENYVYPRRAHDVPCWLNEGLAVMFEGALLEAGSLRLDAPNRTALARLKADVAGGSPLSLAQLLGADTRDFFVSPDAPAESSHRYYDYAWGLVYYLTFERQLLGSPALDAYVARPSQAVAPVARFERLVETPIATFEDAWQRYILGLQ